ncbi:unnamed protein product [Parnassius mnemosyne]|uniref:Reverse transcriptase domain-containing protein n=1 Tax=Parnassius mnemosyne TaxID=213953 RepID=A0AAV1L7I8_9NEOP
MSKITDLRIDILGYADDLVIIARGFCQSTLSLIIENTINNWCRDNRLSVTRNADKTVIMPFTKKRRLDKLVKTKLSDKEFQVRKNFLLYILNCIYLYRINRYGSKRSL